MKSILHYVPAFDHGGIESLIIDWFENIDKKKYKFYLLINSSSKKDNIFLEKFISLGGEIIYIEGFSKNNFYRSYSQLDYIMSEFDFDIIHCHSLATSNFVLSLAKKHKIKKRIFHAHTNTIEGLGIKKIIKNYCVRSAIRHSNVLLACSKAAGDAIFQDNHYEIIDNGISMKKFLFDKEKRIKIRKSLNISEDIVVLGYVARFTKSKNHKFLIEVIEKIVYKEKLNGFKVLLIGDGPELASIKNEVTNRKLLDYFNFMGTIINTSEYYNAMDIFVFPSMYEGFGTVAIEAQVNGLPTILSVGIPKSVIIFEERTFRESINEDAVNKWADIIISKRNLKPRFLEMDEFEKVESSKNDIKNTLGKLLEKYNE